MYIHDCTFNVTMSKAGSYGLSILKVIISSIRVFAHVSHATTNIGEVR